MKISPLEKVPVTIRFITIMQRYSGQRELQLDVPPDPSQALNIIINKFNIPWKDKLEKSSRIFINKQFYEKFIKSGQKLKAGDIIAFIPMSGGG
jgi:molybdopterin converting factor small subunit